MYCQVIVDIVHENVAQAFTYRVPEGMNLERGQRVRVPFRSGALEGIVLSLSETADFDPKRIRSVIGPLEDYPAILPAMMELAEEMAREAHCPLAETLRLMIPAQMRGGRVRVREEEWAELAVSPAEAQAALAGEGRSPKRREILRMLLEKSPRPVSEIRDRIQAPREALNVLADAGLIRITKQEQLRSPESVLGGGSADWLPLTPGQQEVMEEILPALKRGKGSFLLYGVTGSGKTEVFLNAVRKVLDMGKSALILVPEIALTPQMVSWFQSRFGAVAAVLHSRLSPGERYDEWRRIRRGEARVVIGARSAVFAPADRLGLIVVDEEHESTYYSDHHPRYDARDVALSRCKREGAVLILASATPSILSFARARRGDSVLLEMPVRVQDRPLPEVRLVDMRRELESGNRSVLSRELVSALGECLKKKEQAMLLINRRGYHSFVSCRACGHVIKCPNCDVSLTCHVEEGRAPGGGDAETLRCHYCGHRERIPSRCPSCGSPYIRYFGAGTQKVEDEVRKLFPGTETARMDIDTTSGKDGHAKILERFRSGAVRVLIGTQMIAKGLDFPKVTLVGIVAADLTLNLPDYRSRERTFQLLTQAAGRAGRGQQPGRVIIQTYRPEDPVLNMAAKQNYRAFFEEEFRRRRQALYPPFTVMMRLLAESRDAATAERTAGELEKRIREAMEVHPDWKKKVLLLSDEPPGVRMLRGMERRQILVKSLVGPETDALSALMAGLAEEPAEGCRILFEYNPTSMM
ncbi:MAG: primosomal protein N' [Clostridia bacterium]|nr:primosomal protein N' [Clostridia bacterium]